MRDLLVKTLTMADYEVDTAADGQAALDGSGRRLRPADHRSEDAGDGRPVGDSPGAPAVAGPAHHHHHGLLDRSQRHRGDQPRRLRLSDEAVPAAARFCRSPRARSASRRRPSKCTFLIQLSGLTKSFGERVLLDDVTWQVNAGDRVGLAGPNGAGKTTLLRMLAGLDEPDSGAIVKPAALTVGYLPQDGLEHSGRTLVDEASLAFRAAARRARRDRSHRARARRSRRCPTASTRRCSSAITISPSSSATRRATASSCA